MGLLSISSYAADITVYGKNLGTTTTTIQHPDGTVVTTSEIKCDNFYQDVCYKVTNAYFVIRKNGNQVDKIEYVKIVSYEPTGIVSYEGYVENKIFKRIGERYTTHTFILSKD